MKKENNALYILRLTVTLLLICAAVALALAGVNAITKDRIAAIQAEKTQKAIAEVLPGVADVETIPFTDESGLISTVYKSDLGYAVEVTPTSGFAGAIKMMVGVSHDGKVLGVSIISHAETAGLGAVAGANSAKGQAFRDSFLGLSGSVSTSKDGGEADTITGATITSRAICDGVNAALACVENLG
jgi:electron transport complex protein RnfG